MTIDHVLPCMGSDVIFFSLPLWGVGEEERLCSVGPEGESCSSQITLELPQGLAIEGTVRLCRQT